MSTIRGQGPVDDSTLKSILSDADVCVNPDEVNPMNNLSTMNKIIEYMALGKPIVQFDVKEGRFSAQDASLYATSESPQGLADAIDDVLSDPARAASMGEFGRARFANDLCWETQSELLTEMYAGLVRRAPHQRAVPDE